MADNIILVGTDGSVGAAAAVNWAVAEAELRDADLRILSAYTIAPMGEGQPMVFPYELVDATDEAVHQICDDAVTQVHQRNPTIRVTTEVLRIRPAEALIDSGRTALMTVVGAHSQNVIGQVLLGSVATEVAEQADGPVVVIPTSEAKKEFHGPVVVGVDGSEHAASALEFGMQEASLRGVELYAVHVWEDETHGYGRIYPLADDPINDTRYEQAVRLLAEQIAGWREHYPDVAVHRRVLRGRACDALDWLARQHEAAMIVVGCRGLNRVAGALLGSTSQHLLREAQHPVVVVHR